MKNYIKNNRKTLLIITGALTAALTVLRWGPWLMYGLVKQPHPESPLSAAELGDSFGGVTSVFSFLSFLLLVWTIIIQRDQIVQQKGETRRETLLAKLHGLQILSQRNYERTKLGVKANKQAFDTSTESGKEKYLIDNPYLFFCERDRQKIQAEIDKTCEELTAEL